MIYSGFIGLTLAVPRLLVCVWDLPVYRVIAPTDYLLLSDFLQEFYVLPILDMWYGMYKVNAHKI